MLALKQTTPQVGADDRLIDLPSKGPYPCSLQGPSILDTGALKGLLLGHCWLGYIVVCHLQPIVRRHHSFMERNEVPQGVPTTDKGGLRKSHRISRYRLNKNTLVVSETLCHVRVSCSLHISHESRPSNHKKGLLEIQDVKSTWDFWLVLHC